MCSLCSKIKDAKCCVVKLASQYVSNVTYGRDKPNDFVELTLMNGYVEALERYEENHEQQSKCNNKTLSLPCLNEEEVCFMLNQISMMCESTLCGC